MHFIIYLISFLLFPWSVEASGNSFPVYRQLEFEAGYPWNAGLILRLNPDESICKKQYGNQWRIRCASPFKMYGQTAKGIKLSPEVRGRWEWQGSEIIFRPADENGLKPNTLYKADISELYLPPAVNMDKKQISCRTPPQAVKVADLRFMIDPSRQGRHRLITSLEFNYPVKDESWFPVLQMPFGAIAGSPECVWNNAKDRLTVNWPVLSLPEKDGYALLNMGAMGETTISNGVVSVLPPKKGGFVISQELPARNSIFKVKNINLEQKKDSNLNNIYVLSLDTTLHAYPKDISRYLRVLELPEYNSSVSTIAYDWSQAPYIPRNIKTKELKIKCLNNENLPSSHFEFDVPVEAGKYILTAVNPEFASTTGIQLHKPWFGIAHASELSGDLGFTEKGNVLPVGSELGIYGNNLDCIRWEINSIDRPFLGILALTSSQPFEFPLERLENSGMGIESVGESLKGSIHLPVEKQGAAQFASLDMEKILKGNFSRASGLFHITLKGFLKDKQIAEAKRLILVTDLAVILKTSPEDRLEGFVSHAGSQEPASDALVSVLASNGKPIAQGRTDKNGHIVFSSLRIPDHGVKPVAVTAEAGDDFTWISLQDKSRELDYSDFSAVGRHAGKNNTLAYVFNERNIYRPGDRLNFGCFIRKGDFMPLPADVPFYAELLDPRGQKIWETHFKTTAEGLAEIGCPTEYSFLSGRYSLNIKTSRQGEILASSIVRIEDFQPDLLKIKVIPPEIKGWLVAGSQHEFAVKLQNLYGTPAAGNRINAKYQIAPAQFRFAGLEKYIFTDPAPFHGGGNEGNIGEANTGEDGQAVLFLNDAIGRKTSANVTIMADGFDRSGSRACGNAVSLIISPVSKILGWTPEGALTNLSFIEQNTHASVNFIGINNELSPVLMKGLTFSLARKGLITNLISDGNGGFRYDDVPLEAVIKTWQDDIPEQGKTVSLPTDAPGDFILTASDSQGHILARIPFSVAGDKLLTESSENNASKMRLRLNKGEFNQGENILAAFSLPYDAQGLLCIESDGVKAFKWVKAHAGENMAELSLPADFEGKGYVTATFMRSPNSGNFYLNPLAFAVAPFTASVSSRKQGLILETVGEAAPGGELTIRISAKKPGKAILMAVDEGILQLGNFKNPNPVQALLTDRALDVKTLQTGDLLLPFYGGVRRKAFGGGTDAGAFGRQFQNPFKRRTEPPLVFWSGLIDVGVNPVQFSIPVPPWYAGSVRLIAVSSAADSVDAVVRNMQIKPSVVLTPVLPFTVNPGDRFRGGLILANTTGSSQKLHLSVTAPPAFNIYSELPENLELAAGKEYAAYFDADTLDCPGACEFIFTVKADKETFVRKAGMVIRPPSAMRTTVESGRMEKNLDLGINRNVYPGMAKIQVSLSALPVSLAQSLAGYLDVYPYGCTEQLISRSLAQISLNDWPAAAREKSRQELCQAALQAIRSRFNYGQGVSLWPGNEPDPLVTVYALDYLLSLRETGFGVPVELMDNLADAILWNLIPSEISLSSLRTAAYGIWTVARTGRIVTRQIEELVSRLQEWDVPDWKSDLIFVLLAAAQREMQVPVNLDFSKILLKPEGLFDRYAQYAIAVQIQARYYPELSRDFIDKFIDETIHTVNASQYATFSGAQGIKALAAISRRSSPLLQGAIIKCEDGENKGEYTLAGGRAVLARDLPLCSRYKISAPDHDASLFWQLSMSGYDRSPVLKANDAGIEISREYIDDSGRPVDKVKQGDELTVRISARASGEDVKDAVIADILPGGFEMVISAKKENLPENLKWIDRKEDRMLIFGDLGSKPLEYIYRIRASVPGEYNVPPVTAESMYNSGVNGNGGPVRLLIEAR